MPKDNTNEKSRGHQFLGCTAVATGQLLYYGHYKWENPVLSPSHATYNESANKYEFTQFTSTEWDKMYKNNIIWADPSAAMFLGWIAKSIRATPYYEEGIHKETGAYFVDAADFINQQTGYTASVKGYNRSAISYMLKNGKPVLLRLTHGDAGHIAVIDAMDYHAKSGTYYYAYVSTGGGSTTPNPTPGPPSTSTDPEYDALVAQYGEIVVEPYQTSTSYFKFNWGYYGGYDDDYYVNGDVFTMIYHSEEGDITYKLYQYIDYEIQ